MGAKTWMLVHSTGNPKDVLSGYPAPDREATIALVNRLYPGEKLLPLDDGNLYSTCPPDDEIVAGCFPGLVIVAAKEFGLDYPSRLEARFLQAFSAGTLYLHAMHSAVDWLAFGVWRNGTLQRSLSLSPNSGMLEDSGSRLPFEAPFWAGAHPATDPNDEDDTYPFVFHPLELGEAALQAFFGYQLEGVVDPSLLDPGRVSLMRFQRKKAWWRFGK
jgi:hypothetical protein